MLFSMRLGTIIWRSSSGTSLSGRYSEGFVTGSREGDEFTFYLKKQVTVRQPVLTRINSFLCIAMQVTYATKWPGNS